MAWDPSDVIALASVGGTIGISAWTTLSGSRQLKLTHKHEMRKSRDEHTWQRREDMSRTLVTICRAIMERGAGIGANEQHYTIRAVLAEADLYASEELRQATIRLSAITAQITEATKDAWTKVSSARISKETSLNDSKFEDAANARAAEVFHTQVLNRAAEMVSDDYLAHCTKVIQLARAEVQLA